MFYPILSRREEYKLKRNGSFYSYSFYRAVILEDCQNRCVYCDLLIQEHAYEGMHLDHFRPQNYFSQLTNDPKNLVIACPKCNALKTNHWPGDKTNVNGPCHDNNIGFIDPFSEKMLDYFRVESDGSLSALKKPADYIIELLKLNRSTRVLLRKRRMQMSMAISLNLLLEKQIDKLIQDLCNGNIDKSVAKNKHKKLKDSREIISKILTMSS